MPLKKSCVDPKILYVPHNFQIELQIVLSIKFDFVSCIDVSITTKGVLVCQVITLDFE
jgi:hypothetical protein